MQNLPLHFISWKCHKKWLNISHLSTTPLIQTLVMILVFIILFLLLFMVFWNTQLRIFGKVMEDVTTNLRQTFADDGVDEEVLNNLLEVIHIFVRALMCRRGIKNGKIQTLQTCWQVITIPRFYFPSVSLTIFCYYCIPDLTFQNNKSCHCQSHRNSSSE